jgi:hypothetical protein
MHSGQPRERLCDDIAQDQRINNLSAAPAPLHADAVPLSCALLRLVSSDMFIAVADSDRKLGVRTAVPAASVTPASSAVGLTVADQKTPIAQEGEGTPITEHSCAGALNALWSSARIGVGVSVLNSIISAFVCAPKPIASYRELSIGRCTRCVVGQELWWTPDLWSASAALRCLCRCPCRQWPRSRRSARSLRVARHAHAPGRAAIWPVYGLTRLSPTASSFWQRRVCSNTDIS